MPSTWKKVIVESGSAELTQLTIPTGELQVTPLASNGGAIEDKVLVHDAAGNFLPITQSDLGGINTTYDVATGLSLSTEEEGATAFTMSINEGTLDHDSIPHYSGSSTTTNTTEVHYAWGSDVPGQVIHSTNYTNTELTNGTGVGDIAYSDLTATNRQGDVSSSNAQAWTSVGALGSDDAGSNEAGSINGNFNIDIGSNHIDIQTTNPLTNPFQVGAVNAGDHTHTGPFGGLQVSYLTASTLIASGSSNFGDLGVDGTFYYNGTDFNEFVTSQTTSSVVMGAHATASHSFTTDFTASQGFLAASFTGTGSGLTGIAASQVAFGALTMSTGFNTGSGFQHFNFQAPATMALQLWEDAGRTSGLGLDADGIKIKDSGVISVMIVSGSFNAPAYANTSISGSRFNGSIISRHTHIPSESFATNDTLMYEHHYPNATTSGLLYEHSLGALKTKVVEGLPNYSATTGTVTSMSVAPLEGGSTIDGLFLTLTNATTTPAITIEDIAGGVNVNNTDWTASAVGADDQFLSFANGGLSKGTEEDSVALLLAGPFESNTLAFGTSVNDVITIPGNLNISDAENVTIFKSENLIISDSCFLMGKGAELNTFDFGITFGQDPTQSNTLMYDSGIGNKGRFGMGYAGGSPELTTNLGATKVHFVGVFSGSADGAESVKANVDGNMRVDSAGEIYFHV